MRSVQNRNKDNGNGGRCLAFMTSLLSVILNKGIFQRRLRCGDAIDWKLCEPLEHGVRRTLVGDMERRLVLLNHPYAVNAIRWQGRDRSTLSKPDFKASLSLLDDL